jgi:hypothetical protein
MKNPQEICQQKKQAFEAPVPPKHLLQKKSLEF